MTRTYSDPSYGSKKILNMTASGSTVGTAVGTNLAASRTTVEFPITIQDWQLKYIAGGTTAGTKSILINTSLAGTGANVAVGTIALGTNATGEVRDGALTATNLNAGDDLILTFTGTDAIVANVQAQVTYVERYVQSDT
jgi:hypothetical protein